MAGMLFILFLLVSICLLIFVVWLVARLARQRGRRGWLYGMTVFLAVLGLLFWDWLPMEISYRNKCENEAGLTVYKTLEEWKIENPRVWETLTPTPYWRGLLFSKKKRDQFLGKISKKRAIRRGHSKNSTLVYDSRNSEIYR